MKVIHFLFLGVVLFSSFSVEAGSILVGNGGEGIDDGQTVYLRELYESVIWRDDDELPYRQFAKHRHIEALITEDILSDVKISRDLLIRKLSQIDSRVPNLGLILADVIQMHQWSPAAGELPLLPDYDPTSYFRASSVTRKQIALRYGRKIQIDTKLLERMPESHRVALIVHEAIYSMSLRDFVHFSDDPRLIRNWISANLRSVKELVQALWRTEPISSNLLFNIFGGDFGFITQRPSWTGSFEITYSLSDRVSRVYWEKADLLFLSSKSGEEGLFEFCKLGASQKMSYSIRFGAPRPYRLFRNDVAGNFSFRIQDNRRGPPIRTMQDYFSKDVEACYYELKNFLMMELIN